MKKKLNYYLYATIIVLTLTTSCTKDDENSNDNKIPLLSKIYWNDTVNGSYEEKYVYDNNDKPIQITSKMNDEIIISKFSYNSEGKIKSVVRLNESDTVSIDNYTWKSDTLSQQLLNRQYNGILREIMHIDHIFNTESKVSKIQFYVDYEDNWYNGGYEINTWNNSNLTKCENYSESFTLKSNSIEKIQKSNKLFLTHLDYRRMNDSELHSTSLYEYDDKINPYASLYSSLPHYNMGIHNVIKETYKTTEADSIEDITTHTYEYNDKGYPTKETISHINEGATITEEHFFEYK